MTTPAQQNSTLQAQLTSGSLAGPWTIDSARSAVTLATKSMWGLMKVKGGFGDVSGEGTVSAAGDVTGQLVVQAGSFDSKNAKRDKHLHSSDFFHAEKYPAITFGISKVVPAGSGVTVSGTLTVKEVTRPVSFPATVTVAGDGEVTLDASVHVDRSEFGLTWNQMGMAATKNDVTIHAVLTKN